ncbi:MAG: hypothetical protein HQ464_06310 [Planctomycetes bacterium]|nr:hypothetical protein [Planctomycetota bacterium]
MPDVLRREAEGVAALPAMADDAVTEPVVVGGGVLSVDGGRRMASTT